MSETERNHLRRLERRVSYLCWIVNKPGFDNRHDETDELAALEYVLSIMWARQS